jgi:hypothetical protein
MESERSRSPVKHNTALPSPGALSKKCHFTPDEVIIIAVIFSLNYTIRVKCIIIFFEFFFLQIRCLLEMYGNVSGGGKLDRLRFRKMMHTTG